MSKLNRELIRLAEHQTNRDDAYLLGKGVFMIVEGKRKRKRTSPNSSSVRIGDKYQVCDLPEAGSVESVDRGDMLIMHPPT